MIYKKQKIICFGCLLRCLLPLEHRRYTAERFIWERKTIPLLCFQIWSNISSDMKKKIFFFFLWQTMYFWNSTLNCWMHRIIKNRTIDINLLYCYYLDCKKLSTDLFHDALQVKKEIIKHSYIIPHKFKTHILRQTTLMPGQQAFHCCLISQSVRLIQK